MVEAAVIAEAAVERAFAGMAEGRMAEVVAQRGGLGQILIEAKRAGERAGDLRHFERVGETRAVVVAFVEDEDLRLVGKPAKRGRMDDAVAVAAEIAARRAGRFGVEPAAAGHRVGRVARMHRGTTIVHASPALRP